MEWLPLCTLVHEMNHNDELSRCPQLIRRWARIWHASALAGNITCEWSSRLRRSLGRAYPERDLVRLSELLKEPSYEQLFDEVLCHEVAHVAVFHLHGKAATSHGAEWRQLLRLAGYEPRRSFPTESRATPNGRASLRYDHSCPVCHSKRTAKRPMSTWRCVVCKNSGLEGELTIQSHPIDRGALDVE